MSNIECQFFIPFLHNSVKAVTHEKINSSKKVTLMIQSPKEQYKGNHLLNPDHQRWKYIMDVKLFKEYEVKYLTTLLTRKIM